MRPPASRLASSRLAAFGFAGIIVPAAIVAVLGHYSLRQWQASAELLFREQARDMAVMTVDKIQMMLRQAEDEVIERLAAVLADPSAGEPAIDRFLAETPLIQRLYLVDRAGRLRHPRGLDGDDAAVVAALRSGEVSPTMWERGGRRDVAAAGEHLVAAVLISPRGGPVLAAFTRNLDTVRSQVLEATIKPLEAPTICAVLDGAGRPVYARGSLDAAALLVAVPFREGLGSWRLALYQPPGASPGASVRWQVRVFMAALGVLVAVIVAGIVATWRLVRRETEMARLKSDFVANVSHDLKTPLSVIRMFGETLEMGRVPDEAARQEYYRVITRESERLTRLIDNVLDFSRIEGGRRTYERVPTAVEPLVRETLEAFAYPLVQQGFKLDVRIAPDLPEVPMDAEAVGQALANLVDNAIKYSGERKAITIDAQVAGARLALAVIDEGIGIPPAAHRRIFEKFYRVGRSDTQGRRGSGVGLALVRHVAEAHGGRVTVESRPGEGSRFTLWLPLGA